MKVATTIQMTFEEDQEILALKEMLRLSSKKAVVLEGIRILREGMRQKDRKSRLQEASTLARKESLQANQEWSPSSSAVSSVKMGGSS